MRKKIKEFITKTNITRNVKETRKNEIKYE